MRIYGKITTKFWTSEIGKQIRAAGSQVQIIVVYLLTGPSSNMIGLYYLPLPTLCHEVGCTKSAAQKALRALEQIRFAYYDLPTEHVWIPSMAGSEVGASLKPQDSRVECITTMLQGMRHVPFHDAFLDLYREAFHLTEILPANIQPTPHQRSVGGPSTSRQGPVEGPSTPVSVAVTEAEPETGNSNMSPTVDVLFEEFWDLYPMRNGKRLHKAEAKSRWDLLSAEDHKAVLLAVRHYAGSTNVSQGVGIKDPHRWLRDGRGSESWRDWTTPEEKGKENGHGRERQFHSRFGDKDYEVGAF
jgi:hypothetical protein